MPDVYVFPGGRVDAADHRVAAASALRPAVQKRLLTSATAQRAHALAVAAVRETWEETGLAIGENRDGELRPALGRLDYIIRAITPPDMPIRFHARFFTAEIAASDGAVHGNGELLDLAWRSVDECLKLPLADITEFILSHLDELVAGGASGAHAPLFSFRKGKAGLRR
jgi:8-oxo-dGTP pyrophosphatase MutT (NUDIX family)